MSTTALPVLAVDTAAPSDAELLTTLGSLLAAVPGPFVGPRLSALVSYVCATCCPGEPAGPRAQRLELELAEYLNAHHVLRTEQLSVAGLDDWAAGAPIVFLRAAIMACARCQTEPGQVRHGC